MLASGVLERASVPYASPIHILPKDGGKNITIVRVFFAVNQTFMKYSLHMKFHAFLSFITR